MISARKAEANRSNAKSSTGPKTASGKDRTAQNALRHGLSLSVIADPAYAEDLKILQRQIAGKDAGAEVRELARRIAEAQLDLLRIRSARQRLLASDSISSVYRNRGPLKKTTKPEGLKRIASAISVLTKQLMAMDRYERRAVSRRKFAIRDFGQARNQMVDASAQKE